MITPASLNMTIYQGSTFFKRFTWKENRRDPIDITGYTFQMQIRPSIESDIIIAEFSSATGEFYIEDAEAGKFILEIPYSETTDFTFDNGEFDIECTYPDQRVSRIIQGNVYLSKEVTR